MATFVWPIILILNAVIIILLAIFVIWTVQKNKKAGYPMQDERTSKIQGKAALGTYYITLAFIVSILMWNIFGNEFLNFLPELETGWTVIAIMLVMGFSFETILYLEKGKYNPSLMLAHQIAQTLKTTIDDLFIFEDEKTRNEMPKNDAKVARATFR
jgi:DNA-binding XRE family transcriptional regulator